MCTKQLLSPNYSFSVTIIEANFTRRSGISCFDVMNIRNDFTYRFLIKYCFAQHYCLTFFFLRKNITFNKLRETLLNVSLNTIKIKLKLGKQTNFRTFCWRFKYFIIFSTKLIRKFLIFSSLSYYKYNSILFIINIYNSFF